MLKIKSLKQAQDIINRNWQAVVPITKDLMRGILPQTDTFPGGHIEPDLSEDAAILMGTMLCFQMESGSYEFSINDEVLYQANNYFQTIMSMDKLAGLGLFNVDIGKNGEPLVSVTGEQLENMRELYKVLKEEEEDGKVGED